MKRIVFVLLAMLVLLAFLLVRERPGATFATAEPPPLPSIMRPVLVAHSTVPERRARRVKEKLPCAEAISRFEELEEETHRHGPSVPVQHQWTRRMDVSEEQDTIGMKIELQQEAEFDAAMAPIWAEVQEHLAWLTEQIGEPAVTEYQRARGQRMFEETLKVAAESDRELGIVRNRNTNSLAEWLASGEIIRVDGPGK